MLNDKFKPKSYFDFMLCSHAEPYACDEHGKDNSKERFKFVVVKKSPYDGRMADIFAEEQRFGMIPNNMENVLTKVRKRLNI